MAMPANKSGGKMNEAVEAAVVGAMQQVEQHLDDQLDRLDRQKKQAHRDGDDDGDDGLEAIRQRRLAEMRRRQEDLSRWRAAGHGSLIELRERDFFDRAKQSARLVAVFRRRGSSRYSDDLVAHFTRLAQRHCETCFVDIDAENAPFLTGRLNVRVLPSVLFVRDGEIDRLLVGLDALVPSGSCSTISLERKLFDMGMLLDTNIADHGDEER